MISRTLRTPYIHIIWPRPSLFTPRALPAARAYASKSDRTVSHTPKPVKFKKKLSVTHSIEQRNRSKDARGPYIPKPKLPYRTGRDEGRGYNDHGARSTSTRSYDVGTRSSEGNSERPYRARSADAAGRKWNGDEARATPRDEERGIRSPRGASDATEGARTKTRAQSVEGGRKWDGDNARNSFTPQDGARRAWSPRAATNGNRTFKPRFERGSSRKVEKRIPWGNRGDGERAGPRSRPHDRKRLLEGTGIRSETRGAGGARPKPPLRTRLIEGKGLKRLKPELMGDFDPDAPVRGPARIVLETNAADRPSRVPIKNRPPSVPPTPENWAKHRETIKEKYPDGWNPPKKVSREAMDGIRSLHKHDPETFTINALGAKFGIGIEAVRRILKSRWSPDEKREQQMVLNERKRHSERIKRTREWELHETVAAGVTVKGPRGRDRLLFRP